MRLHVRWLVHAVFLAGLLCPIIAQAESRVALVIGNAAYQRVPALPNPTNDAGAVASSLERLGFRVNRLSNGTFDEMRRAILEFGARARGAEMAVVFYAGHGMEVAGENWLIPVDAALKADADTEQEAISLRGIMTSVSAASKLGLIILDACRDNPFLAKMQRTLRTRSTVTRGFARVEPAGSVLVAYAAKDGTTASDGDGGNSPFTAALLRHLETPGLEINFLFRNVRDDVLTATNREQEPFVYGSLSKEAIFLRESFVPPGNVNASSASIAPQTVGPAPDEIAWGFIKDANNVELMQRFIREFPNSPRRTDAEQRISRLTAATGSPSIPPGAAPTTPVIQNQGIRPLKKCFTFNGRQICE